HLVRIHQLEGGAGSKSAEADGAGDRPGSRAEPAGGLGCQNAFGGGVKWDRREGRSRGEHDEYDERFQRCPPKNLHSSQGVSWSASGVFDGRTRSDEVM